MPSGGAWEKPFVRITIKNIIKQSIFFMLFILLLKAIRQGTDRSRSIMRDF
jgi:hypothetical protein